MESQSVEDAISCLELPFSVKKIESGGETCNEFAVFAPDEKLNDTLSKISTALDLRRKENVISVYDTFATLSPHLDRLRDDARDNHPAVSPLDAIVQPLNKFLKFDANRGYMIAIASVIALVGLWLNNVAIVIGAMLLSPLL